MRKNIPGLSAVIALALVSACSTPESRIRGHQSDFNRWPADVQQKVQAGRVDIGFIPEMVQVALGDADRAYTQTTLQGTSEVWGYFDHGPKFAVGVGVSGYSGRTGIGGGVALGNDTFRDGEVLRIVFRDGRVVAIESRRR